MENVNLSESKTLEFKDCSRKLLEWFEETGNLSIANYQRPYAWTESLIVNFTENILKAISSGSDGELVSPDIGLIVIEKKGEEEFVADGQQRLLTMALILLEALPQYSLISENSRLKSLLKSNVLNLQTYRRIVEARKYIKNCLANFDPELLEFSKITCAVTELLSSENQTDPWIIKLFNDVNSNSKQLNGGQILKAYHLGKIKRGKFQNVIQAQAAYEQWRKKPEDFEKNKKDNKELGSLKVKGIELECFNFGEKLSLDEFIDSPGQNAWYKLGHGFVQSVQAILLKHPDWWFAISMQGEERIQPFDRLEGQKRKEALDDGRLWCATKPLLFTEGDGYFQTINRFAELYKNYSECLDKLSKASEMTSVKSPGCLVCDAAKKASDFMKQLISYYNINKNKLDAKERVETWSVLAQKIQQESSEIEVDESLTAPLRFLGLSNDENRIENQNLGNTTGGLSVAIFANALYWADCFGDENKGSFYKDLTDQQRDIIVNVLAFQLICARFAPHRYSSVLCSLNIDEFQNSALVSVSLEAAQWRYLRKVSKSLDSRIKDSLSKLQLCAKQAHPEQPQLVSIINSVLFNE